MKAIDLNDFIEILWPHFHLHSTLDHPNRMQIILWKDKAFPCRKVNKPMNSYYKSYPVKAMCTSKNLRFFLSV